jgi:hypothetical protein
MATRSKKVLKTLADKAFEPEKKTKKSSVRKKSTVISVKKPKKTKKSKSDKKLEIPVGSVLSWSLVWEMLKNSDVSEDQPMLINLPKEIHVGEWSDGNPRIAQCVGFTINDEDKLCTDFFQIIDGVAYPLEMHHITADDVPPPGSRKMHKGDIVN